MIDNTKRKLREARFFHGHLVHENRRPVRNEPEAFGFYLSAFLSAARSVTFALQKEEKSKYDNWFWPTWMATLKPEEAKIFDHMKDQRNAEVKETGANRVLSTEYVPIHELPQERHSHPAYGFHDFSPPGAEPARVGIPVSHFTIDGNPAEVVEVCTKHLRLLERLVQDFIGAHGSVDASP
jgi:hypothetical protein